MAKSKAKATIFEVLIEATGLTKKKSESADAFKKRLFAAVDSLDDDKFEEMPQAAQEIANEGIKSIKTGSIVAIPGFDGDDEDDDEEEKPKAKAKETKSKKPVKDEDDDDDDDEEKPKSKKKPVKDEEEDEDEEEEKPKAKVKAKAKAKVEDDDDDDEEEEKPKSKSKLKAKAKDEDEKPKKGKKAKAEKGERKPRSINREGAVYKIKEAVLKNITASSSEIFEAMEEQGIKCTESTVQGIRSDFINSLYVLHAHKKLGDVAGFPPKG